MPRSADMDGILADILILCQWFSYPVVGMLDTASARAYSLFVSCRCQFDQIRSCQGKTSQNYQSTHVYVS